MNKSNNSERRNQLHEYLYKRNNSQMSIKLLAKVLLMGAIMSLQNVLGLLSEEDMNAVIEVLNAGKNNLKPKLDGPLSPIMLYAYGKADIVGIERIYFQDILNRSIETILLDREYIFSKIDPIDGTVKGEYGWEDEFLKKIVSRYNKLINMFPSPDGKISIYPKEGCKDFFTSFLKSGPGKEYAHRILAILLIQAEGVPMPLRIEGEESTCPKLTWTNECNPEESFSVPICTTSMERQDSNSSNEEENIKKISRKLLHTIKYLLNAELSQELRDKEEEIIAQPESIKKEIYWMNDFTNTPTWLIRSYIYYYLETKEDVVEFYAEIEKILLFCFYKYPLGSNYRNIAQKFFEKSFACKDEDVQSDVLKWWGKIKEFEGMVEASKKIQPLPFADNSQLPTKATVRVNVQGDAQSGVELISSDLESVLLTLLCCFVYDPETNTYNVDHLPFMSKEVKNLFGISSKNASASSDSSEPCGNPDINNPSRNNMPVIRVGQEIPQEVWSKWCKIIQNIVKGDRNISYITVENNKCVLEPNIFNILIIMIKLTGIGYNEYIGQIRKYRGRLQNPELTDESYEIYFFTEEIVKYAKEIFSQITREPGRDKELVDESSSSSTFSKNERTIYVDFEHPNIQIVNNTNHLAGRIMIRYATQDREQRVFIGFVPSGKIHLGIGKSWYLGYPKLLLEIDEMPKDSYSMYVLYKYVEAIKTPSE
ncbi:hypothetical protein NEAUS03_2313 [Nematocida ausubeli]|nr:hypothetical protein NEAUS03_2313 [Nematocida ausubeli]